MARYQLYFLKQGMLVDSGEVEAPDDREAERLAAALGDGRTVEVWNASRRVRIIAPSKAMPPAVPRRA